jgi:RNA polymerase sigma-70 factor (ECF subfamily)
VDDLTRLALAARDGNRDALSDFLRAAQPEVRRYAVQVAGRHRADDVTQDVLVRVLRALPSFRGVSSARTWLLAIARHTFVDLVRRDVRRQRLLERLSFQPDDTSEPQSAVDLDALVAGLAPDRRSAFVLTQVLGLGYEEAASVSGCPVGTIRSRVSRARGDLVAALGLPEVTPLAVAS